MVSLLNSVAQNGFNCKFLSWNKVGDLIVCIYIKQDRQVVFRMDLK